MPCPPRTFFIFSLAILFSSVFPAYAQKNTKLPVAKAPMKERIVRVTDVFGTVEKKTGNGSYSPLALKQIVAMETTIRTGDDSAVLLELPAHTHLNHHAYVRIGAKSVIVLSRYPQSDNYQCKVLSGQAWGVVHPNSVSATLNITTPSAVTRSAGGVWGVGYDLETDISVVSFDSGTLSVGLPSGSWRTNLRGAGMTVRYLRRPQPNIRLRAPEAVAQTSEQKAMWKLLRAENWIALYPRANMKNALNRGTEDRLRGMIRSVEVVGAK